ncbi:para-nitrobenzyl esterase [Halopseudomonas pachastrellae]|nr:carboxylesterase family protein [Halopseudomonas pachastrellae]SFM50002.1 para-nitrobenzyl esterase [Halopseudomonas pachastrellae]
MQSTMKRFDGRRSRLSLAVIAAFALPLAGCLGGGGGSDDETASASGVFVDSPVAGLNYSGSSTAATTTGDNGEFSYQPGETLTFAIGDLQLGSASGAEVLTPLDIVDGAVDASDQRVANILVLLQSLDADGDLNNGIQLTAQIRDAVSAAGALELDQSTADFLAAITDLVDDLETAGAFSDTDPRPRAIVDAADAQAHFARASGPRIEVETTGGTLRGFEASADAWQFLGVPYAKPPLGELRWQPPQAAEAWEGVRDAVDWADQSAQDYTLEGVNEGGMSEDSLYLNVTAPKDADNLPVMVWFHGGSFAILSANSKQYNNPDGLTEKDVVLVTVNHRLGPFGYIAHPLLTAESGYNGSGNYGQMDLVMALEWVRDNIAAFGGDSDNVTIFGQSGGGGKVYSLMNSPQASGLFHKAIVQSGFAPLDTTSAPGDSLAESEAIGEALFERAGVTTLEEARALPWTALAKADLDNSIPRQTYRPNVDYYYQPKTYYQNVLDGMPSDVPLMAGVTNGDYTTLRAAMPIWLQQRSARYESDQFIYRFSRVPPGWAELGLTSCHGCELPYLFNYPAGMVQNYLLGLVLTPQGQRPPIGDLNGNGVTGSQGDAADVYASMRYGAVDMAVAEETMLQWTNFAKTGNPSTDAISWTAYTLDNDALMEMGADGTARMVTGTAEPR